VDKEMKENSVERKKYSERIHSARNHAGGVS
jgi:hypothetical protein